VPLYRNDGLDIKLAICCSSYLDFQGLKRLYESCNWEHPAAPQYFIDVDGVYTFFRFKNRKTPQLSDDGSNEWIQKQPHVILIEYPGYQVDKRTKYLEKAVELECDAIIVVDSDEYFHEDYRDWGEFRKWLVKYARSYDAGCDGMIFNLLSFIDKDYVKAHNTTEVDQFTLVPRLWHSPKSIEYYNGVHYWVRRKNSENPNEALQSTQFTIEYGVRLSQDSKLRNPDFLEARDDWAKQGIFHEDKLIKRYNNAHNLPYRSIYNMVFGDSSSIFDTNEAHLNPLFVPIINYYNPDIISNYKQVLNLDKIYMEGFDNKMEAIKKARDFMMMHEEYTHLIVTCDNYIVKRYDVNCMINHMAKNDVVSGWNRAYDFLSFTKEPIDFRTKKKRDYLHHWDMLTGMEKNDYGLIPVKYSDIIFMGLSKRAIKFMNFDIINDDIEFCWDITHDGYDILIDPNMEIKRLEEFRPENKVSQTLLFEKRYVDIDSFIA